MKTSTPKDVSKNGIDNWYITAKILLEFPEITPKQMSLLLETMDDFNLLSKDGREIKERIDNHVWII